MIYLWATILVLLDIICLALVAFAVPGTWLMVIAASAFAYMLRDHSFISVYTLIAITVLAVIGEILEFLGGMGGAKKAGAGFWGAAGAIIGAVIGAVFGTFMIPVPIMGTLVGSAIGAAVGSAIFSGSKGQNKRTKVALHAGLGQFIGSSMKLLVGIVIWFVIAVAAFWP